MVERETERSYFIVRLPIKVVEAFSECLWNLVVVHDYNLRCDGGRFVCRAGYDIYRSSECWSLIDGLCKQRVLEKASTFCPSHVCCRSCRKFG